MKNRIIEGSVSLSEFVSTFNETSKTGQYTEDLLKYYRRQLNYQEEGIFVPVADNFDEINPNFSQEMIKIYNGICGNISGVESIPDEVKILQGVLFDTLCFGVNVSEAGGKTELYTLRSDLFGEELEFSDYVDVVKKNLEGLLLCKKVTINNKNVLEDSLEYKYGVHRAKLDCTGEKYRFVPLPSISVLSDVLKNLFDSGMAIRVLQQRGSAVKIRVISTDYAILSDYAGFADEDDCVCEYDVTGACIYAPSIGASSLTVAKTKIDLFNLLSIGTIRDRASFAKYGIEKSVNAADELAQSQAIISTLTRWSEIDIDSFKVLSSKLPKQNCLGDVSQGVTEGAISSYVHSLTKAERNNIIKDSFKLQRMYDIRRNIYGNSATEADPSQFEQLVKEGVCQVIYTTSKGKKMSATVTNSKEVLKKLYGEDYVVKFESGGVRAWYADYQYRTTGDIKAALEDNGFKDIDAKMAMVDLNGDTTEGTLRNYILNFYGKSSVERESTRILVRTTTGLSLANTLETKNGWMPTLVSDYYISINQNNIKKLYVLN